jgi:hypothetical protein
MDCYSVRREIEEAEIGQLLDDAVRSHIDDCPPCRVFRDERLALRDLVGSLEAVSVPPDFEFRLSARLASTEPRRPGSGSWNRFAKGLAVALAASCAVLVAAVIFVNLRRAGREKLTESARGNGVMTTNAQPTQQVKVDSPPRTIDRPSPGNGGGNGGQGPVAHLGNAKSRRIRSEERRLVPSAAGPSHPTQSVVESLRGAQVLIKPGSEPDQSADVASFISVPVAHDVASHIVLDDHGRMRKLSLAPVTFGSQGLAERGGTLEPSPRDTRGIW